MEWSRLVKVIYTDECPLYLNDNKRSNPKYVSKTVKFPKILMVWDAIRLDVRRVFYRYIRSVDSIEYQRVLNESLPQIYNTRYIFQHDGDLCHGYASTVKYLEEKAVRMLPNWSPQRLDLNIIKNIWSIVKEGLKKKHFDTLVLRVNREKIIN